jgi:hypothetical protein
MYNIWNCVTILRSFLVICISWILYVTASLYIYMYTRRISISSASITCLSIFMALSSLPISLGWVCFPCLFNLPNLKPCRLYPHVDCLESGQIPNCSGQNPVLTCTIIPPIPIVSSEFWLLYPWLVREIPFSPH